MTRATLLLRASFLPAAPLDGFIGRSIAGDAYEYEYERETVHVVAVFPTPPGAWSFQWSLHRDLDHGPAAELELYPTPLDTAKAEIVFSAAALAPGRYGARAILLDAAGSETDRLQWDFVRLPLSAHPPAAGCCPVDIPLLLEPYPASVDADWAISTSIPLARGLATELSRLVLLENGNPIPAQFAIRSRWSAEGSLCWVALDFVARYTRGVPTPYVIRVLSEPRPATTTRTVGSETSDTIVLRAAGGGFVIHKSAFAGVIAEPAGRPPQVPEGGPYVVDEQQNVYEARHVAPDSIELVENGPIRATVSVKGWYGTDPTRARQTRLCRYVTHITAFADSPLLRIAHRTIITFDPDVTRLADVGWRMPLGDPGPARFAIDGTVRAMTVPRQGGVFVHQDRHDRCWIVEADTAPPVRRIGPMRRSDGALSVSEGPPLEQRSIAVLLRDVCEKFPKEFGVSRTARGAELSIHFWPRHGQRAFPLQSHPADHNHDELHRNNIYKLWYAHQGSLLDLKMPAAYVTWLEDFNVRTARAGSVEVPILDDGIALGRDGKAIGVAIANEFGIVAGPALSDGELLSLARAFQTDPHAIASPEWSSRTEVEGPLAPYHPAGYPRIERAIENGVLLLRQGIVEAGGEYGMWIYANVHGNWEPFLGDPPEWGAPRLHRVWQASHYRNVWTNWMLYLRSGSSEWRQWARATSDHFLHIGTVNYADPAIRGGKFVGEMYHCYATTPWGGESDVFTHWIDPDAHRLRGLLCRDDYALDMYRAWFSVLRTRNPSDATYDREATNTFGAVVGYYLHYQDADALLILHKMASNIFGAYSSPDDPGHFWFTGSGSPSDYPVWHRQCYMNYHRLTRDPRAVQLVVDWLDAGYGGPNSLSAFVYRERGDIGYLSRFLPDAVDQALLYHDARADRYHGYGPGVADAYDFYFFQEAPYFLRALAQAGLQEGAVGTRRSVYPSVQVSPDRRNVENSSAGRAVRAYVLVPATVGLFTVRLDAVANKNAVHSGQYEVSRWSLETAAWIPDSTGTYPQDPGTVTISVANANLETLYRIDIFTPQWSDFLAPFTGFPEVIEVERTLFNGVNNVYEIFGWRRQSFWIDWDPAYSKAELGFAGLPSLYHLPSFVRVSSAAGQVESGRTVFAWAQDRQRNALPDLRAFRQTFEGPRPLQLYVASVSGPLMDLWNDRVPGPPRIFLALERSHLAQVIPRIP